MSDPLLEMDRLPELRKYQDQPKQMRAAARGKVGRLELGFRKKNDITILAHMYRETPLLVQQALYHDESWPTLPICPIISIGGGVLQGDRYSIEITVDEHSEAKVTTQSATRIQQMDANYATQYQKLIVGASAYLEYVPDVTILYKHSRYACETVATVNDNGVLLYGETIMLGRIHHLDERYLFDLYSTRVSVFREDGRLIFSEKQLITEDDPFKDFPSVMGGFDIFSNVTCIAPVEITKRLVELFPFTNYQNLKMMSGLSVLPKSCGVIFRIVGNKTYHVNDELNRFVKEVRQLVRT